MVKNQKRTQQEAEIELYNKWPNIRMENTYQGTHSKMEFKCLECGHTWVTIYSAVLRSANGCPKCGVQKAFRKRSIQYIQEHLSNDFEFISYKDPQHIEVKCKKCGNIRITSTGNLLKYGCKVCSNNKANKLKTMTLQEFIDKAKNIHENQYDYSKVNYINYHTKVCIICPIHGEFWITPAKHLSGQKCPKCRGKYTTKEDFIKQAQEIHGTFYSYDKVEYINKVTPVTLVCPIHGEFNIKPVDHINSKCGCHKCKESSGEKLVNSILESLNISFTREVSILNPYNPNHNFRVDFYIDYKNSKYIIEYNGPQHYKAFKLMGGELGYQIRKSRDENLRQYCKDNNINLLEIKYNDKNVQELIQQFLNVPSVQVTKQIITEQKR